MQKCIQDVNPPRCVKGFLYMRGDQYIGIACPAVVLPCFPSCLDYLLNGFDRGVFRAKPVLAFEQTPNLLNGCAYPRPQHFFVYLVCIVNHTERPKGQRGDGRTLALVSANACLRSSEISSFHKYSWFYCQFLDLCGKARLPP